ncbi:hypothetical protein AvCA_09170 [Azotobacter vinelandii CA]|uniref:Uncharacterized protein n=2 Tax=Azotobacter vinelandii TaxID=354 RepID=C1DMX6_AZOVD|nr:hypothetical protein Avin_09170 [Azotobacter vinelandii DJ]AGK15468.1 hypothetical protein AvCA_09170 [Azotobacter vinelandii CA]AGK19595.1 hypothetical protein AvCA6_09170 [Azotobacter vinelandii CA6]
MKLAANKNKKDFRHDPAAFHRATAHP